MALHEQSVGASDEWYTPPRIFEALGCRFDMDVASPGWGHTRWIPADAFLTHDSLARTWKGFVWMNAPFGGRNGLVPWLAKFFEHGNGIALVPDRTSAPWWQTYVPRSDVVLFVSPKIHFVDEHGNEGKSPAQGTCLLGLGQRSLRPLHMAEKAGLGVRMMRAVGS